MLASGWREVLAAELCSFRFTTEMAWWLANSLHRLNRSHGYLMEHFGRSRVPAEPVYFELAFFGAAEDNMTHFFLMARKVQASPFEKAMAASAQAYTSQPQWRLAVLGPFIQ